MGFHGFGPRRRKDVSGASADGEAAPAAMPGVRFFRTAGALRRPVCVVALAGLALSANATPALGPVTAFPGGNGVLADGRHVLWSGPAKSVAELAGLVERSGMRLDRIRATGEVRRVLLATLPSDFDAISVPAERKALFINLTLPLVLRVNEAILHVRERIVALRDREAAGTAPTPAERLWLRSVADRYAVDKPDYGRLLTAVDVIPPSLAIAQAAEESGWGTSRFARHGNALFGQRVYERNERHMVPGKLGRKAKFRVRKFDSLLTSVASYARNLNSHFAYEDFREARAGMRRAGRIDGDGLADSLRRYSERKDAYVASIRRIIRFNGLQQLDTAFLR